MDIETIKRDFPQFYSTEKLIYLDSAASSLTPESVLSATEEYYRDFRANTHRGFYKEAQKATEQYEATRKKVADFIGAREDEIIFTPGATAASNMLISILERSLSFKEQEQIVTTVMEHHALLLPLQRLAKEKGLTLQYIGLEDTDLKSEDIEEKITKHTKIVGVSLASNVLGTIQDVKLLAEKAHTVGAYTIVDGTAAVGHIPVNVKELGVDFLFFSGHKMCGPTGVGVLFGKKELLDTFEPSVLGGGIVEDVSLEGAVFSEGPIRFEAGTQNIAGVIGLGSAVEYLSHIGVKNIRAHVEELTDYAQKKLRAVEGVELFSAPYQKNVGIVSFLLKGVHPHDIAEIAGRSGVALRAGHHCALPLHKTLGLGATARASFYLYNDKQDIDMLVASVEEAKRIFTVN